ncbi:pre-mRNA-splicing factor Slu7 [Neocloeon triangulifer]|uniref:pre-mRNA-splicing factor Slu7 n=1 Tax=Neocloeon triangulifer TaxID=2078957 RepID=UPI00286F93B7|nr:pre-mRNA-splicing factor Slu7 [Neocloeon triangulifer]
MAATPSTTVSEILKSKSQFEEDEPKKKSREEWRKAKELEEARKAGTAPAAVDEEGRDINPHIPQYISSAPWYYGTKGPTLKHQRPQEDKEKQFSRLDEWYKRGVDKSHVATKFRKGACENCGALTHKRRDCMERPRKIGAKYTGLAIAPDEFSQPNLAVDYDGKRDRWNGYDPAEHKTIVEEFQKVEEAKRKLKAEKLKADGDEDKEGEGDDADDDEEDEDKYADDFDMPGTKVDSKQRITVRNLRIREDTAKYLRNLDPNSAYYDPKTRSMRDNPNEKEQEEVDEDEFVGENAVRFSGDTRGHAKAQIFAWDAHNRGVDVHLLAEPTKLELLQKEYESKKESFKSEAQSSILARYGGEEHLKAPPKSLLLAQTETYIEYSRSGRIVKGQEKQVIRSRYEEDQLINNHTSVWGSYWKDGTWGFKCCHSFIKNSYCVGESGRKSSEAMMPPPNPVAEVSKVEELVEKKRKHSAEESSSGSSSSSSAEDDGIDEEEKKKLEMKIRKKLKKKQKKLQRKAKKQKGADAKNEETDEKSEDFELDERKRKYNSMYDVKAPTEEEMESYYKNRKQFDDPMQHL